ncbi:MAG: hypothetical protein MUF15_16265, partial [Acidobacteria bacterium]|nr:hypothetical protein [Acidobacteriota bacterium]
MNTIPGLKELKKQLDDATHDGYLALTPELCGSDKLASFLMGLPSQQINLFETCITLDEKITLLTVAGRMNEDWSIRGLEPTGIHMTRLYLEYTAGEKGIIASVKTYGTLNVGSAAIEMTGSLTKNNLLLFNLKERTGISLSLSSIANFISNDKLSSYLPAGIDLFDQVPLTALDFSCGFKRDSVTQFNFTSDLQKTWTIIPDLVRFQEVGVTLNSQYGYRKGYGFQSSIGGNIHGTLNIPKFKQDIKAILALEG